MFLPTNMSESQLRQKPFFVKFVWSLAGSVCSSTAAAKRRRLPPSVRCLRTRPPTSPHHFCSATYADFYPALAQLHVDDTVVNRRPAAAAAAAAEATWLGRSDER